MSGSDNLSGRLYLRAKELASSSIGFSGSIIFLTLLSLGIIFGIRIQLQPPSNEEISVFDRTNDSPNTSIEDANFTKESSKKFTATEIENNNESRPSRLSANSQNDLETGALDSASVDQVKNSIDLNQSSESLQKYSEFIEVDEKLKKSKASELKDLVLSKQQIDGSSEKKEVIVSKLSNQFIESENRIVKEQEFVDVLSDSAVNKTIPESLKTGFSQARIAEKDLENSLLEYESRLDSDETISEEEKNRTQEALFQTRKSYNEIKEGQRDSLLELQNSFSNDEVGPNQQELLRARINEEDMERANQLRKQKTELDQMVSEGSGYQGNFLSNFSDEYLSQKFQSDLLSERIDGLHDYFETEKGLSFKPDQSIEKIFSNTEDQLLTEEIDNASLFLMDSISDDISEEEELELMSKYNNQKSKKAILDEKKKKLLNQLYINDQDQNRQNTLPSPDIVEKITNVEEDLDIAQKKLDMILEILSKKDILTKESSNASLQNQKKALGNDLNQNDEIDSEQEKLFDDVSGETLEDKNLNPDDLFSKGSNNEGEKILDESEALFIEESIQSQKNEETQVSQKIFITQNQVNDDNKLAFENAMESQQKEFENYRGGDLSDTMRRRSIDLMLKAIHRPDPEYPKTAILNEIEGRCLVKLVINNSGETQSTDAKCSDKIFKKPSEEKLNEWRFQPDEYLQPVVEITYNLN